MVTTVLLIKEDAINKLELHNHYLNKLSKEGIPKSDIVVLPLLYNTPTKIIAKTAKAYLDKLIGKIPESASKLIIADSNYFKFITKIIKVSDHYSSVLPGKHTGYNKYKCVYVPNYKSLFKQPDNSRLIDIGIKAITGTEAAVLIKHAEYGFKYGSDRELLDSLYQYPVLAADIETTGLDLNSKIVSIAFAWSKHHGIAIDLSINGIYYLKKFLETYKGKLIFHNGLFDAKLLIRSLWMNSPTDYSGMLEGLSYFKTFDDTMIMAYLAKNATTGSTIGLKNIALEYVGNYALEIHDLNKYS